MGSTSSEDRKVEVKALSASGAIEPVGDGVFVLSDAGRARVRREGAAHGDAFVAQHRKIVDRDVIDDDGKLRKARALIRGRC